MTTLLAALRRRATEPSISNVPADAVQAAGDSMAVLAQVKRTIDTIQNFTAV